MTFAPVEEPVKYRSGSRDRKPVLYETLKEFFKDNPTAVENQTWFSANGNTKSMLRNAAKALGFSLGFGQNLDGSLCFKVLGPYRKRTNGDINNVDGNSDSRSDPGRSGSGSGNPTTRTRPARRTQK